MKFWKPSKELGYISRRIAEAKASGTFVEPDRLKSNRWREAMRKRNKEILAAAGKVGGKKRQQRREAA